MASETATIRLELTTAISWRIGVVIGSFAVVAMGTMMVVQMRPVLEVTIPSMYSLIGGVADFIIHVTYDTAPDVAFANFMSILDFDLDDSFRSLGAGTDYGVVLRIVLAVLVMPVWLGAVGSPVNPLFPSVNVTNLAGRVVYGVVLGASYSVLDNIF